MTEPESEPQPATSGEMLPVRRTMAQRSGLIVLLAAAVVYAGVQLFRNPRYVSDPQPLLPSRAGELADKIDPNTADAGSLSALPQVGEKRARELIAYRERAKARQKDGIVFHRSLDLLRVPGFGPSLANQMEPYLIFPTTTPASMPGAR